MSKLVTWGMARTKARMFRYIVGHSRAKRMVRTTRTIRSSRIVDMKLEGSSPWVSPWLATLCSMNSPIERTASEPSTTFHGLPQ